MPTVKQVYDYLDGFAPFSTAESWDNTGLLVGSEGEEVTGIVVALDVTREAISLALEKEANLIVTHHPVIFTPVKQLPGDGVIASLIQTGTSVISAHTNLDLAKGGVNDALCEALGLRITAPFENSDHIGYIAELPREMSAEELAEHIKNCLGGASVTFISSNKTLRSVAVVSGAGGEYLMSARTQGVDALITGEAKHHELVEAVNAGFPIFAAGHHATEAVVLKPLQERLAAAFPTIRVMRYDSFPVQFI